jgi:hypothetical protein
VAIVERDELLPVRGGKISLRWIQLARRPQQTVEISPRQGRRNCAKKQYSPIEIDNVSLYSVGFPPHENIFQI